MTVGLALKASLLAWLGTLLIFAEFGMASDAAVEAGPKELRKKQLRKILGNQEENTYMRDMQVMCVNIGMNTKNGSMIALSSGPVKVVIK